MANKIEIFENTLLKLLVRRGIDADRQNIVLSEGELGYTIDTKKLYIGDGQTFGGIAVGGSRFLGSVSNILTLAGATSGDLAFSTSTNTLYTFKGGDYTDINDWSSVGGVYTNGNATISINPITNTISVGTISAANLSKDVAGANITLDASNRISLSSQIAVDAIKGLNTSYINLPGTLNVNNINYNWPGGGILAASYLKSDISGNLSWSPFIDITTSSFVYTSAGTIPVGTIMPYVSSANAPSGWLLCNGQSVACASFPELSAVIGYSYGGSGANFKVPNLINKTLYGVSNSPSTSTLYSISSGQNSSLSATGALYIIKAKPDLVTNVTMSVASPLCAAVNDSIITGSYFTPLSGKIDIGLTTTLTGTTTVLGGFVADTYGRVILSSTPPAGNTTTPAPGTRSVYNGGSSPIGFFTTPAYILNSSATTGTTFTISAFPYITDSTGTKVGSPNFYSVPSNAKNLIVDATIVKSDPNGGNVSRIIAAAPNSSLLTTIATQTIGANEFMVASSQASGGGDRIQSSNQVIIPLSATATGDLVTAFRVNTSSGDSYWVRVVGYTL